MSLQVFEKQTLLQVGIVFLSTQTFIELPVVYSLQTYYNFFRGDNKERQYELVGNVDPHITGYIKEAAQKASWCREY
jgi:hypothetical protein